MKMKIEGIFWIMDLSPTQYLSLYLFFSSPERVGPFWGTTTTRRSPYSLSVANIGPSSLTSHR